MLPSKQRLSRVEFQKILTNKGIFVIFNKLGTLKYIPSSKPACSVVTSSKGEKRAVVRNKLRRRIYSIFGAQNPAIQGILYVSKQSYGMDYQEIRTLFNDLLTKAQKNTK